jgi:glycosyltransferase involved in cell wall biosynthesis
MFERRGGLKMPSPLVSVVIPAYNREKTIKRCLDSVVNQTYTNLEIIVVDDCSDDSTAEIVSSYNDSRIKLITLEKNSGAQAARNRGIKEAAAGWITFLDSDDEWILTKTETQIKILEEYQWEPFIVVHSDAIILNEKTGEKKLLGIHKINGENAFASLLRAPGPLFQAMITSKKALESIGCLDENAPSYQEWDTAIRLAEKCRYVFMENPVFIYHVGSEEQISKNFMRDIEGYDYIINKFEKQIKIHCGENMWYIHLGWQYLRCRNAEFHDKANYYLSRMPLRKRIFCLILLPCFLQPVKKFTDRLKRNKNA